MNLLSSSCHVQPIKRKKGRNLDLKLEWKTVLLFLKKLNKRGGKLRQYTKFDILSHHYCKKSKTYDTIIIVEIIEKQPPTGLVIFLPFIFNHQTGVEKRHRSKLSLKNQFSCIDYWNSQYNEGINCKLSHI